MNIITENCLGFKNGEFTSISSITIPVNTIGVNRGYGVFDFFGVINQTPFYLDRHLNRFFNSINTLRLTIEYNIDEVEHIIKTVIQKNDAADYYIKLFALPMKSEGALSLESGLYIIPVNADPINQEVYIQGGSLITKDYQRFLPEVKTTNYLPVVYWYSEIVQKGALDVLYCHHGIVRETSRGNVFMIKNDVVYSPATDILKGITRSVLIDLLNEKGIPVLEIDFTQDELKLADEVFLTSTTKKILPIVRIDDATIADGRVGKQTVELMQIFKKLTNKGGLGST
jgi:branched-subunit amino acid aminotransferase/4-amino-4-deoxychorismate lyase